MSNKPPRQGNQSWVVVAVVAGTAFGLGVWGYVRYYFAMGGDETVFDAAYKSLNLFRMKYDGHGPIPWQLEIARFLAPATTLVATFKVAWSLVREKLGLLKLKVWSTPHYIVFGNGRYATDLSLRLLEEQKKVILIETDKSDRQHSAIWAAGGVVLSGAEVGDHLFRAVRLERAEALVAIDDRDEVNISMAQAASKWCADNRSAGENDELSVYCHIADPGLQAASRDPLNAVSGAGRVTVRSFNLSERAARLVIERYPLEGKNAALGSHPCALIVGGDAIGESLVVRAAMTGQYFGGEKLRLTYCADLPDRLLRRMRFKYPALEDLLDLTIINDDPGTPDLLQLKSIQEKGVYTSAYVCLPSGPETLWVAKTLRKALPDACPVVAILPDVEGVSASPVDEEALRREGVVTFHLASETCTPSAIMGEDLDRLGKSIHDNYCKALQFRGESNTSVKPWAELEDSLRDANRNQADHIAVKLRSIGCEVVPVDEADPQFRVSEQEILQLSEMEHRRWVADKLMSGWAYDAEKNVQKRLHPLLVDWNALSDSEKDKDRDTILEIPAVLALAGKGIKRGK